MAKAVTPTLFQLPAAPRRRKSARPKLKNELPQQFIKYMGSKAPIIDFVIGGIEQVYDGGGVCDLFAGSCVLSGAIGRSVRMFSNDIQAYSRALAGSYLTAWRTPADKETGESIAAEAAELVSRHAKFLPPDLSYENADSLKKFNAIDARNRELIDEQLPYKWHLFAKSYSGTWWSAEQCLWIDAIREVAERRKGYPIFDVIIASLMHAMAYSSQGTGHYAQYRDAKDDSSFKDIAIYRRRNLRDYFVRKFNASLSFLPSAPPKFKHEITALDYRERLATLPRCTVYADPPYAFVHYSRFYHAIETVYLYDFPRLQVKGGSVVKGRYREDRHQSPFCIASQVPDAFAELFKGVARSGSNLVLSYSNTGMIALEPLEAMARETLGGAYEISTILSDHKHMTMGRREDRDRNVSECLLLARAIR